MPLFIVVDKLFYFVRAKIPKFGSLVLTVLATTAQPYLHYFLSIQSEARAIGCQVLGFLRNSDVADDFVNDAVLFGFFGG
jgi:hypothetical protein